MKTLGNRLRSMLYVCPALAALYIGSAEVAVLVSQPARAQDVTGPNVTKISYSPDGQTAYHHYKDGHIEGWRGGKVVMWIAPVARAATPSRFRSKLR